MPADEFARQLVVKVMQPSPLAAICLCNKSQWLLWLKQLLPEGLISYYSQATVWTTEAEIYSKARMHNSFGEAAPTRFAMRFACDYVTVSAVDSV